MSDTVKHIIEISEHQYEICKQALDMAISALSVPEREKGGWIPVTERLPEKNRAVLTYVDTGASKTYCLAYWKGEGWEEWIGYRMLETEMGYKVLAWQPLPKPYKVESEVKPNVHSV